MQEKGILHAIAEEFSNTRKVKEGVELSIVLTLSDLSTTRDLHVIIIKTMKMNLSMALIDCANGKQF